MSITDRLSTLDRLQKGRRFKVVASAVIVVLAIVAGVTALYAAQNVSPDLQAAIDDRAAAEAAYQAAANVEEPDQEEVRSLGNELIAATREESRVRLDVLEEGGALASPELVSWAVPAIVTGVVGGLLAVWLGLALSYLALAAIGLLIAGPMLLIGGELQGMGLLIVGVIPLIVMLLTLLQVARLALSPSLPTSAIAKNVLSEAVRMRISLVFIVVLVMLLAVIPLVLEPSQPLRYRVSQWIQYGGGLGFLILALMTVFFCSASVAFEQRDKLIWQTVSKPVSAMSYVAGKWAGVMMLNLVLLSMTAGAVFLFTQYLTMQPARGEVAPYITEDGFDTRLLPALMTEDRRILEREVLVARESVPPSSARQVLGEQFEDTEEFERLKNSVLTARQSNDPSFDVESPRVQEEARLEAWNIIQEQYFSIPLGQFASYEFRGLGEARDMGEEGQLTLRYRIQAGSNDPSAVYTLRFRVNGAPWPPASRGPDGTTASAAGAQQVALDAMQRLDIPTSFIDENGDLRVEIFNDPGNTWEIAFEPGDLEILYPVGGYELNFIKAVAVMWVKLGFIAAVAITAATFLSFPVAVLIALVTLFAAESAGFLSSSLEEFSSMSREGDIRYGKFVIRLVAMPIAWFFESYAGLKPVERLTTGRVLGWGEFGYAVMWILVWTGLVLSAGVAIFRKRELAIYSGN